MKKRRQKVTEKAAIDHLKEAEILLEVLEWVSSFSAQDGDCIDGITAQGDRLLCQWAGDPRNGHWISDSGERVYPVYFKKV